MEEVAKNTVLSNLEKDWSNYVSRYGTLSQNEKQKFLANQGFASFSDLLLHIIAWWEEAVRNIRAVVENPDFKIRDYDVDRFNAEAIQRKKGKTEKEIVTEFEETRKKLSALVSTLNETQIKNPEAQKQLYWMITNHFAEHRI
ncbi:MAG: hypothetical protein WBM17_15280 [Anaerolineales bacterium]